MSNVGFAAQRRVLFTTAPFALTPALLFLPALAYVSVCPPEQALIVGSTFFTIAAASEAWALTRLLKSIKWQFGGKFDPMNLILSLTTLVAVIVGLGSLLGLIATVWLFVTT